jgi:hypothetical protein
MAGQKPTEVQHCLSETVPITTTARGTNLDKVKGISTLLLREKCKLSLHLICF